MEQNLNLYYIFFVVAHCGNISTASKQLYISQPAVSKSIAKLEEDLKTTLFLRSSRGVKLTMEGEILLKQLDSAFTSIQAGEEQLKRIGELGMRKLSIGVSSTLCKFILLPYLKDFLRENPHVKISIACQSTYQTIKSLENGTLDIGIIGEPARYNDLEFITIETIQDTFVATKNYLEAYVDEKNLDESSPKQSLQDIFSSMDTIHEFMENSTLLLLDKNNITRKYVDKYLENYRFKSEQLVEVTSMDLLIEFAKLDMGVACVIESFVEEDIKNGTLVQIPFDMVLPKRNIGIACLKGTSKSPTMEQFMGFFRIKINEK